MPACDLYDVPVSGTGTENIDHNFDGFRATTHVGKNVGSVKMFLYKSGSPSGLITLYHYRGSSEINSYSPDGNTNWSDLSTDSSNPTTVTWNLDDSPEMHSDSVLCIAGISAGSNEGRSNSVTASGSHTWVTQYTEDNGATWITASWSFCGCITEATVSAGGTLLPPPIAWVNV